MKNNYPNSLEQMEELLAHELNNRSLTSTCKLITILMMDTVDKAHRLMEWLENNPEAGQNEILAIAVEISPEPEEV